MSGFNLPPGCSVNDLPGNRPEDIRIEAIYDSIYAAFEESNIDSDEYGTLADKMFELIENAYNKGYEAARQEAKYEEMLKNYIHITRLKG